MKLPWWPSHWAPVCKLMNTLPNLLWYTFGFLGVWVQELFALPRPPVRCAAMVRHRAPPRVPLHLPLPSARQVASGSWVGASTPSPTATPKVPGPIPLPSAFLDLDHLRALGLAPQASLIRPPPSASSGGLASSALVAALRPSSATSLALVVRPAEVVASPSAASTKAAAKRRNDHPDVQPSKGARRDLALAATATEEAKASALANYHQATYAASSSSSRDFLLATWQEFHLRWFGDENYLPLTVVKLEAVAATFRAGRYRSFPNYLSRAKDYHIEMDYDWSLQLERCARQAARAVTRGIGPPRQSAELWLSKASLCASIHDDAPLVPGGPCGPFRMIVAGCFWVLRELEVSFATLGHVTILVPRGVDWRLPVSKTDPQALGCVRTWRCVCSTGTGLCGACAVIAQMEFVKTSFEGKVEDVNALPLFPTIDGSAPSKDAVVATIEQVALLAGQPIKGDDGENLLGGHSLRVTGARMLASLNVDTAIIMALARWAGQTVLHYIGDAPLAALDKAYRRGAASGSGAPSPAAVPDASVAEAVRAMQLALEVNVQRAAELDADVKALSSLCKQKDLVQNLVSGSWHRILCDGVAVPPSTWRAFCGWRFGAPSSRPLRANTWPATTLGVSVCGTCFPDERKKLLEKEYKFEELGYEEVDT